MIPFRDHCTMVARQKVIAGLVQPIIFKNCLYCPSNQIKPKKSNFWCPVMRWAGTVGSRGTGMPQSLQ